ncbi:hypothetical protein EVB87_184 [Rhizobium phage RHph_N28_1]|nr:hypothetical protein EVB87_184 [Rhizobium phage RHph_N28_1]QIG74213.1 hypothetical protein EVC07_185 [Rhizobium phage RHph_N42]QIG74820.1 hypothetical protein EVC12_185 [Rhizobium phage RHph_I42]QXV73872.1 hypothetical protein [Rhizobium phage RHph_N46]
MAKTRISGLVDTSSWGALLASTELEITKQSEKGIRRMMCGSQYFRLHSGDETYGNSIWYFIVTDKNGEEQTLARYEFKTNGQRVFLNASGNPTMMIAGINDVPVLVLGFDKYKNAVASTFKFCNRLVYAIFDFIPSSAPFKWKGTDLKNFQDGNINIKQIQFAWYSGDLGAHRTRVMNFLRMCYGGTGGTEGVVKNLTRALRLKSTIFDDSEGNMSIEAKYGSRNEFLLTLYMKDRHPDYTGENKRRLENLIRFDCSFRYDFLESNRIKSVADLEKRYEELCDEGGYDIGFYKWLSSQIVDRLKLDYIINLNSATYTAMLDACESVTGKNEVNMIDHWMKFNEFTGAKEIAEALGFNETAYKRYLRSVMDQTGLDLTISRDYHEGMISGRMEKMMTREERAAKVKNRKSNQTVTDEELRKRDFANAQELAGIDKSEGIILDKKGVLRLRKMKPRKIHRDKLYVLERMK